MPTAKAGAQYRVPVLSPARRHGVKQGRWGQPRLVGAGEANGGRKPLGQIPSQHGAEHEHTQESEQAPEPVLRQSSELQPGPQPEIRTGAQAPARARGFGARSLGRGGK
jgi:hypothetical protein